MTLELLFILFCSKNSFRELTTRLIENSFVSESYSSFFAFDEKLGVTEK